MLQDTAITLRLIDRPKSYDEMRERPAFREVLDKKVHELRAVLSDYSFPKMIQCGLSECRTRHNTGYLVETTDGLETNVGRKCGRKFFGDAFDIQRSIHKKARDRKELLDRAEDIRKQSAAISKRITTLNNAQFGIRWLSEARDELRKIIGDSLLQSLAVAGRRGELVVNQAKERGAAEIEMILASDPRLKREQVLYETVAIGRLAETDWIDFNFLKALRDELLIPVDEFSKADLATMKTPQLRVAVKQFDTWEKRLEDAESAAATALPFLAIQNLDLLSEWIPEHMPSRKRALREWAASKPFKVLLAGKAPTSPG